MNYPPGVTGREDYFYPPDNPTCGGELDDGGECGETLDYSMTECPTCGRQVDPEDFVEELDWT